MTRSYFYNKIIEDRQYYSDDIVDYVNYHARRFKDTYQEAIRFLKKGDKVLSIGAGCGCIEKMLQTEFGAQVTIVDFPDMIALYKDFYAKYGITAIAADLTKDELPLETSHYDMLLQSEVIEHLPIAPAEQITKFRKYIKTAGFFLVTTPNQGSVLHLAKLLFMQPLLPPAELTFAPVSFENEGIHRREYMPIEIKEAFTKAGFENVHLSYFYYTYPESLALRILYGMGTFIGRFRPGMTLIGKKQ